MDAWEIAMQAAKERPPYLADDELTADRFHKKYPELSASIDDARALLNDLVDAGKLRAEDRRNPKGGNGIKVYIAV